MNIIRLVFLLWAAATIAGGGYLSYYGIGRDSTDLDTSVRTGSPGAGGINGRVK